MPLNESAGTPSFLSKCMKNYIRTAVAMMKCHFIVYFFYIIKHVDTKFVLTIIYIEHKGYYLDVSRGD